MRLAFDQPAPWREADYALVGPIDNRLQEIDTHRFPFNTICHLGRDFGIGLRWGCSGALFRSRRLVTAAHCLFSLKINRAPGRIMVAPGRRDRDEFPFGVRQVAAAYIPRGFIQARNRAERRANDYGLVVLKRGFPRLQRFMPLRSFTDNELDSVQRDKLKLTISGYPADRPVGTQWRHSEILRRYTRTRLLYSTDTCPGHSGSPVWLRYKGAAVIAAIHTSGILDERGRSHGCKKGTVMAPPGSLNSGVRLTSEVVENLRDPQRQVGGRQPMVRVL
ncbi:MAG: trypsin-like serine protease [Candidatus Thiodiazotropha lotti]|nr:trypsin-like serine protease [Candidatus Thiodiazotropha lotti]